MVFFSAKLLFKNRIRKIVGFMNRRAKGRASEIFATCSKWIAPLRRSDSMPDQNKQLELFLHGAAQLAYLDNVEAQATYDLICGLNRWNTRFEPNDLKIAIQRIYGEPV